MNIKPIRTEEDYEAACKRIDEIFQAEPGTPEEEELDILVTLVDAHEEKHFPMGKPHPLEAVKIQMEALGISRKDLMEHLGKSSGRISDMLNCRRALTLSDIRKLNKLLHISMEVLSQEYQLELSGPKEVHKMTMEHQAI
jgi:HTH-type transcriptional regulator / antitoxin HigA